MSSAHFLCESAGSTLSPMTLTLRLSNSGLMRATSPSSVVHTGVKSFGCENRTAQESPIHSWKRIFPWLVCASKSGAVSPIFIEFAPFSLVENYPFDQHTQLISNGSSDHVLFVLPWFASALG